MKIGTHTHSHEREAIKRLCKKCTKRQTEREWIILTSFFLSLFHFSKKQTCRYSSRNAQSAACGTACGSSNITQSDNNQTSSQLIGLNTSRGSSEFDTSFDSTTETSTESSAIASTMGIKEHETVAKTIKRKPLQNLPFYSCTASNAIACGIIL